MTRFDRMSEKINCLQAGRAIAALAVVALHAALGTRDFVEPLPAALAAVLEQGYLGVDFFFVLSGFIIYYTTVADRKNGFSFRRYSWKRASRIFVPYWPVGIAVALGYTILPSVSDGDRSWSWISTLTLLPGWDRPALNPAWTLQHELVFYFLFAGFVALGSVRAGMILWAGCIASVWVFDFQLGGPLAILFAPINFEFLFGVLAARAFVQETRIPNLVMVSGICIPALIFGLAGYQQEHSPVIGVSIAFLVLALCRVEAAGRLNIGATFLLLGNASYAIYLVHNPLLSLTSRVSARVPTWDVWYVALILGIVASVALGLAYHLLYERLALKAVGRLMSRSSARK